MAKVLPYQFTCVGCGEHVYCANKELNNHKCDPVKEARRNAGMHAHDEYRDYKPTVGQRLGAGFAMLEDDETRYSL